MSKNHEKSTEQPTNGTEHCPCCERTVSVEYIGTSPHIQTGEPVTQLRCGNCGAIGDDTEFLGGTYA